MGVSAQDSLCFDASARFCADGCFHVLIRSTPHGDDPPPITKRAQESITTISHKKTNRKQSKRIQGCPSQPADQPTNQPTGHEECLNSQRRGAGRHDGDATPANIRFNVWTPKAFDRLATHRSSHNAHVAVRITIINYGDTGIGIGRRQSVPIVLVGNVGGDSATRRRQ